MTALWIIFAVLGAIGIGVAVLCGAIATRVWRHWDEIEGRRTRWHD
jgi:hypothetical protein